MKDVIEGATTLGQLRKAAGRRPLVGTIMINSGAEWVELCGSAGLDFVCVDQMVTTVDWGMTADMLRAAAGYGTSGWVRLSAFPWGGAKQGEVLQRDVLKAIAIGAEAVMASVDYPEDLAAMLAVQADGHHRKVWDGEASAGGQGRPRPTILPVIESVGAYGRLAEFMEVDGIEAVFIGLGDLSRAMGLTFDLDLREIADIVRRAVNVCGPRRVTVMANTGNRDSPAEVARAIRMLEAFGVGVAWVPYPSFIVNGFYRALLQDVGVRGVRADKGIVRETVVGTFRGRE